MLIACQTLGGNAAVLQQYWAVPPTVAMFSRYSKVQSMMPLVVTLWAGAWAAISSADRPRRLRACGRRAGSSNEMECSAMLQDIHGSGCQPLPCGCFLCRRGRRTWRRRRLTGGQRRPQ